MRTRTTIRSIAALLCGLLALSAQMPSARAQGAATSAPKRTTVAPEMAKAIRRLLELNKTTEQAAAAFEVMMRSIRQTNPEIPEEFLTRFRNKLKIADLIELYVPLYAKYYSLEEINGLIAFAETPLGQKTATTAAILMREGSVGAEAMGKRIAMEVVAEMQAEGKIPGTPPVSKPKPKPRKSGAKG